MDAIGYREGWVRESSYKGVFGSALSYEYFLAAERDYAFRNDVDGYSSESPEVNLGNILELRNELNTYCEESELGKLYQMRDRIDALIERIRKEHGLVKNW